MYTRHLEVPVFEYRHGTLDARSFNRARVAQRRSNPSLRLALPRLKHLDIIIQADAWIVVDCSLSDVPVIAWTEFDRGPMNALHTPVQCQIRLFHANAAALLSIALLELRTVLDEALIRSDQHQILPFPKS